MGYNIKQEKAKLPFLLINLDTYALGSQSHLFCHAILQFIFIAALWGWEKTTGQKSLNKVVWQKGNT